MLYNNYYSTFVYVQSDWGCKYRLLPKNTAFSSGKSASTDSSLASIDLIAKTASSIQGPWSDPVTLFTSKDGIIYAPAPQTHYDTSGKTMVIDYSIFSPIYMKSVKVVSVWYPPYSVLGVEQTDQYIL